MLSADCPCDLFRRSVAHKTAVTADPYRPFVHGDALGFYASPGPMSALPDHPALRDRPSDLGGMRRIVQGLLVHRDWAPMYGIGPGDVRIDEQQLRTVDEILGRAFELSPEPVGEPREPIDRVLCICRHFTLLHTALLRAEGIPARVRCGFSNYFDRTKWYDHWITERWDATRWVRDDPQVDELQARTVGLDFDPYDQPPGQFLSGCEAWTATRAGELDPSLFGIFDMWGASFVAGNVLHDLACLNKVELLPWDAWGLVGDLGPHDPVPTEAIATIDALAHLGTSDDFDAVRARYLDDDTLRVPSDITSFVDGSPVAVHVSV
jgi:hypothetical protein